MIEIELIELINCPRIGMTPIIACHLCDFFAGRDGKKIKCKCMEKHG